MKTHSALGILFLLIASVLDPKASAALTWESVSTSRDYICGEGHGATLEEADRNAITDLLSRISMQVTLHTSQSESETATGYGAVSSETSFRQVLDSYSNATLTNTEKFVIASEPEAHVGRAIRRSELDRMFAAREDKVRALVATAQKARDDGNVAPALKNLYWARMMLKTLRNPDQLSFTAPDGTKMLYSVFIPRALDEILGDIRVSAGRRIGNRMPLRFTWRDEPVPALDFRYFDGLCWSNILSARDGSAAVNLPLDIDIRHVKVCVEYQYKGEAASDPDISAIYKAFPTTPLRRAYFTLTVPDMAPPAQEAATTPPPTPTQTAVPQMSAQPVKPGPIRKNPVKGSIRTSSGHVITPNDLNKIINRKKGKP